MYSESHPTEPGYYWCKRALSGTICICKVTHDYDDQFSFWFIGNEEPAHNYDIDDYISFWFDKIKEPDPLSYEE